MLQSATMTIRLDSEFKSRLDKLSLTNGMEIKWLRKALKNLDQEVEYIAKADPRRPGCVSLLIHNPALGHPGRLPSTHELAIPGTRYIVSYRAHVHLQQI